MVGTRGFWCGCAGIGPKDIQLKVGALPPELRTPSLNIILMNEVELVFPA